MLLLISLTGKKKVVTNSITSHPDVASGILRQEKGSYCLPDVTYKSDI
ncbi:MAG: hypothetical protein NZ901_02300 [Geminocystis sp.]|nr:hypothetical protein [Geminocystis sp.]MCS7147001.1 hypothetical protein [Geminocystis sp.]MDW8115825.1 hypothetical protein [Geminocystis sp.]MDW8463368.1 hypothetical protein [Geminocystis sp.]